MTRSPSPWTDDLIQKLKHLWPNYSAGEIVVILARDHGFYLTRNSIVGKAHRLGLDSDRATRGKSSEPKPKADKPRIRRRTGPLKNLAPQTSPVPFVPRVVEAAPPRHLTFAELTDEVCKWECSGQDDAAAFRFCGHVPAVGMPYCAAHCRISYVPPTKSNKMKRAA